MDHLRMTGLLLVSSLATVAACSSSDDGSGAAGSSSSGMGACSCDITDNGVSKTLQCGQSSCVNGNPYTCDSSGSAQGGKGCEAASSSSSSGGSSSGGSSSSSSGGQPATTVTCPNAKDSVKLGTGSPTDTCDAKTQYCILAKNGGDAAACEPLPTSCSDCDCASANADAAWQTAPGGSNCGQPLNMPHATVTCSASNGAITVTCD